jgi:hypothetical protein
VRSEGSDAPQDQAAGLLGTNPTDQDHKLCEQALGDPDNIFAIRENQQACHTQEHAWHCSKRKICHPIYGLAKPLCHVKPNPAVLQCQLAKTQPVQKRGIPRRTCLPIFRSLFEKKAYFTSL